MGNEITDYIESKQPWQSQVCAALRETVHRTLTGVEEVFQYGKPHFVRDGRNLAVVHVGKDKVSFMVFDAAGVEPVPGLLRSLGSGDRKVVDVRQDEDVDHDFIADVLCRTAGQR